MDKDLEDILKFAVEDNLRIRDVVAQVYEAGFQHGKDVQSKTLPPVTKQQVLAVWNQLEPEIQQDSYSLASAYATWFNDPHRRFPVVACSNPPEPTVRYSCGHEFAYEPGEATPYRCAQCGDGVLPKTLTPPKSHTVEDRITELKGQIDEHLAENALVGMHPDLVWLAAQPPETFNVPTHPSAAPRFYRDSNGNVGWYSHVMAKPAWPSSFSEEEINEARKLRTRALNQKLKERFPTEQTLDLDTLPDYETWFETHGNSLTKQGGDGTVAEYKKAQEATVHDLYKHFRARLLDELRQAGVIGDDS